MHKYWNRISEEKDTLEYKNTNNVDHNKFAGGVIINCLLFYMKCPSQTHLILSTNVKPQVVKETFQDALTPWTNNNLSPHKKKWQWLASSSLSIKKRHKNGTPKEWKLLQFFLIVQIYTPGSSSLKPNWANPRLA